MDIIYPIKSLKKIIQIGGIAFVIICFSFGLRAQSVIFKKGGTQLTTKQVSLSTNIISYFLESDSTGVEHFISKNVVDSIRYQDGKVERFPASTISIADKPRQTELFKNSVGLNIWPLFNSKFNFYYERLFLNNKLGFKNYFMIDAGTYHYTYGSLNQLATFYYSAGLNYYFLQSYFFRAGTGASVLTGKFGNPYWGYYGNETVSNYTNQTGILLNASVWYIIHKRVNTSLGLEIPVGFDFPENAIIFRTEISINF
jgi:hypothetical protein